jgi:ABC-2 type transport system permease protein
MLFKLTVMELKLAVRDKVSLLFALLLPLALLCAFGLQSGSQKGSKDLGGQSAAEYIAALGMGIVLAILGFQVLPAVLSSYRERGILRRLSTTPIGPRRLLTAQVLVNLGVTVVAVVMLVVVGRLAFGTPLPQRPGWFVLSLALGVAAMFAFGLLVAAVAPTGKAGNAIGMLLFFPSLLMGGVYIPREQMPAVMRDICDYTPLGAALKTVRDSWMGSAPHPLQLVIMAAYAVVVGTIAARLFRWE